MQWLGTSRQPAQRSRLNPPRARKGLALRARRALRSKETAWGMRGLSGLAATDSIGRRRLHREMQTWPFSADSPTRLIEEGLQLRLRAQATAAPRCKLRLPVVKGRGGLLAGVDPLSNRSLLAALGDDA